jgi:formate hydrogenlyase subunit 6/NADH:ubiquinone oxidoreductase subunit I
MAADLEQEVGPAAVTSEGARKRSLGIGLLKGLTVTLKHMLRPAVTQQYPEVKPDLPPRTRGVIALKEANCTVCYKCSRECPDWCIYIDAHKETHPPASGGKARSAKILDRFAIDYALCMYCGICVEVCPFDALFWAPDFDYAEYDLFSLTHEKERLEEWTYKVLPPLPLEEGAEPVPDVSEAPAPAAESAVAPATPTAAATAPAATAAAGPAAAPVESPAAVAPAGPPAAPVESPAAVSPAGPPAAPAPAEHVDPDQETFDRVLAEEMAKGTDRRVAEGRARAAGVRAARKKLAGG